MSETVPIAPVAAIEEMTKPELYAHLNQHHYHTYLTSKSQKNKMIEAHDRQHENLDFTREVDGVDTGRLGLGDQSQGVTPNRVHEHFAPAALSADSASVLQDVRDGKTVDRMLSVAERRALEKLIDNDFAGLRTQMIEFAAATLAEKLQDAQREWADRVAAVDQYTNALQKILVDGADRLTEVIESAALNGVTLSAGHSYASHMRTTKVTAKVNGLTEAEAALRLENSTDLKRALLTLERQRLSAQRTVLLAGVSKEGQALLDTIPTAQQLMVQAAGERAQTALQSPKEAGWAYQVVDTNDVDINGNYVPVAWFDERVAAVNWAAQNAPQGVHYAVTSTE
jgi:hypothetical protein